MAPMASLRKRILKSKDHTHCLNGKQPASLAAINPRLGGARGAEIKNRNVPTAQQPLPNMRMVRNVDRDVRRQNGTTRPK